MIKEKVRVMMYYNLMYTTTVFCELTPQCLWDSRMSWFLIPISSEAIVIIMCIMSNGYYEVMYTSTVCC